MVSIRKDPRNGNWLIRFRWDGMAFCKSSKTSDRATALRIKGRVEDTLRLLEVGRIELLSDADPATWIMSEGKLGKKQERGDDTALHPRTGKT